MTLGCALGPQGPRGEKGELRTEERLRGDAQSSLTPSITTFDRLPSLPALPPAEWLELVFQDIRLAYARTLDTAGKLTHLRRLEWLQKLTLAARASGLSPREAVRYDSVSLAISGLLGFIELGSDALGQNQNLVTLLSPEHINDVLDSQVRSILLVEEATARIRNSTLDQRERLSTLRSAAVAFDASIRRDQQIIDRIASEIARLKNQIGSLLVALGEVWVEVFQADLEFRQAVARRAGCDFEQVVQCASLIATVVATGGSAVGVLSALGGTVEGIRALNRGAEAAPNFSFRQIQADVRAFAGVVRPLGEDIGQLRRSYQELRQAIDSLPAASRPDERVPAVPNDYVKILASKTEFDRTIQPFLGMPEARRYQALMAKFIATAESRNNLIVAHDAKVASLLEVYAEQEMRRTAVQELASTAANTFDARLEKNLVLLERYLGSMKVEALRQLIEVYRAIEYVTLIQARPQLENLEGTFIASAAQQAKTDYHNALGRLGQPIGPPETVRLPLRVLLTPTDLERLAQEQIVTFAVPSDPNVDPFRNWYAVQTVGIAISDTDGRPLRRELELVFENQGRSLVFDEHREQRVFTHLARIRGVYRQDAQGNVLSAGDVLDDDRRFLGVSPYGPWRIRMAAGRGLRLRDLDRVALIFRMRGRVAPLSR